MNDKWEEQFDEVYEELTAIYEVSAQRSTLKQRAADAHPILIALAQEGEPGDEEEPTRTRPTTEYSTLANKIGSNATYIWKVLVAIDKVGSRVGDPPVSPLVERGSLVGPGHGYFDWDHLVNIEFKLDDDRASLPDEVKKEW